MPFIASSGWLGSLSSSPMPRASVELNRSLQAWVYPKTAPTNLQCLEISGGHEHRIGVLTVKGRDVAADAV